MSVKGKAARGNTEEIDAYSIDPCILFSQQDLFPFKAQIPSAVALFKRNLSPKKHKSKSKNPIETQQTHAKATDCIVLYSLLNKTYEDTALHLAA